MGFPGTRRTSYGPTSPTVGERGARTRERIITETLELFSRQGFNHTSVRDIADAAGISRAALYQYFESKEEIFIELLEECGGQLLQVMHRIGPLGPSETGFANLRRWLVDWAEVYENYGTLFVQWANVDLPVTDGRSPVSTFLRSYNERIASRLRRSGITGMHPLDAAIITTSVVHRFNYLRYVSRVDQGPLADAVSDIGVVLQCVLFPNTPDDVLRAPGSARTTHAHDGTPAARQNASTAGDTGPGFTARSAATRRRIMDAGAHCLSDSGYYRVNVDDIVRQAGLARGTFYKYFEDKLDLLIALSDECEDHLAKLDAQLNAVPVGVAGGAQRRAWMAEFLDFRAMYIGVMRTWIERAPPNVSLDQARDRVSHAVHESVEHLISGTPIEELAGLRAVEVMLIGLLERLPDAMADNARLQRTPVLADLMASVIERAVYRVA